MHTQITDEIMKNLQRRSPIEVSQSTSVNKYRYKSQLEQQNSKTTIFDKTQDLLELEQVMLRANLIKEP